eukprot:jgi/Ulvmu1/8833/UM049_0013.1
MRSGSHRWFALPVIGVGVRGGPEILSHALAPDFSDAETVTVQLDLENAFNLIDRETIIAEIDAQLPALAAFARMAYGAPSPLLARRHDGSNAVL